MNARVVLSTDLNPEYLFYAPISAWCWNKFGFSPMSLVVFDDKFSSQEPRKKLVWETFDKLGLPEPKIFYNLTKIRTATLTQVIRLYGFMLAKSNDYVLLGDIDMIPLNSFLYRDFDKVNVFGYDLTDFTQIPMCYVGMSKEEWKETVPLNKEIPVMPNLIYTHLLSILQEHENTYSNDFDKYWYIDQQILTECLKNKGFDKINFINRGKLPSGYAKGRVDRGDWRWNAEEYMDAHLPKNPLKNFESVKQLIDEKIGGNTDWMIDYKNKFQQLM
jgi:hypothetical protein